jgi:coproporphyrinogen III oxidase
MRSIHAMPDSSIIHLRNRVRDHLLELQDEICRGLEGLEGEGGGDQQFAEDVWEREGGGGGRSRVLAGGDVLEKAGVNFSEVHGELSESFAGSLPGSGRSFYATGVSLVLHPRSPHLPTAHANFRHIQHGTKAWFGGGADLTPYYLDERDCEHFHGVWREVCERFPDVADHGDFSDWCDRYFYLPHRGERRGVGGLFFDYLWVLDEHGEVDQARAERVFAFVSACGQAFLQAYLPIARRHLDEPVTEAQRRWHELRRGRYVEFNLVYDRGTIFGLKTGGRTESILMSLPPRVRWDYGFEPEPGTPEARLLEHLRRPPPAPPDAP